MWLDSQFQNAVEAVTVAAVQRGIENHQVLVRVPNQPAWKDLTDKGTEEELNLDAPLDELEVASAEGEYESYDPEQILPVSLAEVEAVKNMRFEPDTEMEAPADLYAAVKEILITTPTTMDELMVFLGIMYYITLTDKGRYVEVGRDLALDEASIACRSRHGRRLIVFNPQKPAGNNSDIADRLQNVVSQEEMQQLREELEDVQQSVAVEHNMLAASWCDGNIVTMVTNAYPSTTTMVT
ncbi:hypothetical protein PInf_017579 [Phytophthora infestans]|nr:hypothetical protein PInf_017579 [Phytophthora infestans]